MGRGRRLIKKRRGGGGVEVVDRFCLKLFTCMSVA